MKINIDSLPSRGIPYNFEEIEMQKFGVAQIMKLSKAISLKSLKPAIDAIDDVLNVNAFSLTDGDFFYLLTLQRLNYTHPLFTEWTCNEVLYYVQDTDGEFYTKDGIKQLVDEYKETEDKEGLVDPSEIKVAGGTCGSFNRHELKQEDLEIRQLDNKPLTDGLDYPRIESFADSLVDADDPDMQYLSQAIRWLKTDSHSYLAKKDLFLNLDNLELVEQAMLSNNTIIHGVHKQVVCECAKCGAKTSHILDVGPETFFDV